MLKFEEKVETECFCKNSEVLNVFLWEKILGGKIYFEKYKNDKSHSTHPGFKNVWKIETGNKQ